MWTETPRTHIPAQNTAVTCVDTHLPFLLSLMKTQVFMVSEKVQEQKALVLHLNNLCNIFKSRKLYKLCPK